MARWALLLLLFLFLFLLLLLRPGRAALTAPADTRLREEETAAALRVCPPFPRHAWGRCGLCGPGMEPGGGGGRSSPPSVPGHGPGQPCGCPATSGCREEERGPWVMMLFFLFIKT